MSRWLEDSKKYKRTIKEKYLSLYEADRTRFISKNPNLSEEQKSEIIEIFKKFPAIDKDIKWGSNEVNNWSYEQFKPYLDRAKLSKKQSLKNGLEGLVDGQDYRIVKQYEDGATSYEILTHKASAVIASNQVAPEVWTPMPYWNRNEDVMSLRVLPFGKPKNSKIETANESTLFPGAKWCTAMQTSDRYWNQYTEEGIRFIYIVSPNQASMMFKKIALAWKEGNNYEIFDTYDFSKYINDVPDDIEKYIKDAINWLNKNKPPKKDYIKLGILSLNKETNRYDCADTRNIEIKDLIENGKFKYPLGIWNGDFNCSETDLISLEGAPTEVKGSFNCNNCNNLTSLQGAPKIVKGDFDCEFCNNLISLEGAPQEIWGDFDCRSCINLLSLKGAPQVVKGYFTCNTCNNLVSLEGAPQNVNKWFDCSNCDKLFTLKGAPKSIGMDFFCCNCNNLTSLEGAPQEIGGGFECRNCNRLISLKGAPQNIEGSFDCACCNNLTSLEGAPTIVGGSFNCSGCKDLTSLKGAPQIVGSYFTCDNCNNLNTLEGAPQKVIGNFYCYDCNNLISLKGAPQIVKGNFYCNDCNSLTSLEGFNTQIGKQFCGSDDLDKAYQEYINQN